jgi:hypothetical protein
MTAFLFIRLAVAALVAATVLVGPVHASLIGAWVNGSVTNIDSHGLSLFTDEPAVVSEGAEEFRGNRYTSDRTVVDVYADFSAQTLEIGFQHVGGDLGLSDGNSHWFSFTDILFSNPEDHITQVTILESDYFPSSAIDFHWGPDSISIGVPNYGVGLEAARSITFGVDVVPEPPSVLLVLLGTPLLVLHAYTKHRRTGRTTGCSSISDRANAV